MFGFRMMDVRGQSYGSGSSSGSGQGQRRSGSWSGRGGSDRSSISEGEAIPPKMIYPAKYLKGLILSVGFEARERMKMYEFHPNWLCHPKEIILHETELEAMISCMRDFANDVVPRPDNELYRLKTYGLAPIMSNNGLAYLAILNQDPYNATGCLEESNRLINVVLKTGLFAKDYALGLFYVAKGLKMLLDSFKDSNESDTTLQKKLLENLERFQDLPLKAKAVILASKHLFLKLVKKSKRPIGIPSMEEVVYLDPDHFEWRIYQYLDARQSRIETKGLDSAPTGVEITAIQHAWDVAPNNPLSIVYLCLCLAEELRNQRPSSPDQGWRFEFGQWSFNSRKDASNWIEETTRSAVKASPFSVKVNLCAAEIVGYLLPFKHRDINWSQECIVRAYRSQNHFSSACNHWFGLFMLRSVNPTQPPQSLKSIQDILATAFTLNSRNTDALYQLLLVLLREPKNNYGNIRSLLSANLNSFDHSIEFKTKLLFLRGCLHMMTGDIQSAIWTWMLVYRTKDNRIEFSVLNGYSYVYQTLKWSYDTLNLPLVIFHTYNYYRSHPEPRNSFEEVTISESKSTALALLKDELDAFASDTFAKSRLREKELSAFNAIEAIINSALESEEFDESESESPFPDLVPSSTNANNSSC